MKAPREFEAVAAAGREDGFRAARRWLALSSRWSAAPQGRVRFGFTVGKRNARRSVDRATVKRLMREACRHARQGLEKHAVDVVLDIVLRLKAPLPERTVLAPAQFKREIRAEADALLDLLARRIAEVQPNITPA